MSSPCIHQDHPPVLNQLDSSSNPSSTTSSTPSSPAPFQQSNPLSATPPPNPSPKGHRESRFNFPGNHSYIVLPPGVPAWYSINIISHIPTVDHTTLFFSLCFELIFNVISLKLANIVLPCLPAFSFLQKLPVTFSIDSSLSSLVSDQ